jgi:acyl-CoA synthetase (AMP-forming)/AMP-acid ligase II/acyl carrier protein
MAAMARFMADATQAGLLERIRQHAALTPDKVAVRMLADDGSTREALTYRALWSKLACTARALGARVQPGDRVLLLLPTGLDYVISFLGCFGAGACAVPAYPAQRSAVFARRVHAIAQAARPRLVIVEPDLPETTAVRYRGAASRVESVCMRDLASALPDVRSTVFDETVPRLPTRDQLALLQYTSGSTSQPKGVMVSHGNLVANQAAIAQAFGMSADDVVVSWLPLYHDMGLLGSLLQALYVGCELVLLSPGQFARAPLRWLHAIDRYRGTVSGGPDFAYRMCADRIEEAELAELDLSSWRLAFTGAEPIRAATLAAFAERFGVHGFRETAFYACYGLAEATLLVSGGARGCAPVTRRFDARALEQGALQQLDAAAVGASVTLVSCGRAMREHQLRIAAESGEALSEGAIGEIWFTGPSVTQGYFEAEHATRAQYVERDGTRYLRTGDLGALLGGELFVAGRDKDLIIVRGRNLFPQDIEHSIESSISLLQKGRVVAFGEPCGAEECVVVAVEVSRGAQKVLREDALVEAICMALAKSHLEAPRRVLLLKPGSLPKTSSGKLQRKAAAAAYRAGTLGVYAQYDSGVRQGEPTTDVAAPQVELTLAEQRLAAIWKELLGVPVEHPDASFFALGGNSLLAAQLVVRLERELGTPLALRDVFAVPSLRALADRIAKMQAKAGCVIGLRSLPPAAASRARCLALTAAQRSMWLALTADNQPAAFQLSVAIELRGALDVPALRQSLQLLMQRHDALRTSFDLRGNEPLQRVHHNLPVPKLYETDLEPALRAIGRADAMRALVECQIERGFDLARGPLWACALARLDAATSCLVLTAHHLVLDSGSLSIVLGDLAELYAATCAGRAPRLQVPVTVRELLAAEAARNGAVLTRELTAARSILDAAPVHGELPRDRSRPTDPSRRADRISWTIPEPLAEGIVTVARSGSVPVSVVLLTAYAALMQRSTGAPGVRIGMPLTNRQGALSARAVALCMRTAILALPINPTDRLRDLLPPTAAQVARLIEQRTSTPELLTRDQGRAPLFHTTFAYQEDWSQRFRELGPAQILNLDTFTGFTRHDLNLTIQVGQRGQLTCHFEYATDLYDPPTIQRLTTTYANLLTALAFDPQAKAGDHPSPATPPSPPKHQHTPA